MANPAAETFLGGGGKGDGHPSCATANEGSLVDAPRAEPLGNIAAVGDPVVEQLLQEMDNALARSHRDLQSLVHRVVQEAVAHAAAGASGAAPPSPTSEASVLLSRVSLPGQLPTQSGGRGSQLGEIGGPKQPQAVAWRSSQGVKVPDRKSIHGVVPTPPREDPRTIVDPCKSEPALYSRSHTNYDREEANKLSQFIRDGDRESRFSRASMARFRAKEMRTRRAFPDMEDMKERIRELAVQPQYSVVTRYHTEGVFQQIARSTHFEHFTLFMIALSGIWLAVDTDHNNASVPTDAHPVFQVADNMFCAYFFCEWLIRLMAFKDKRSALGDPWFCFDTTIVTFTVLETWVMSLIIALSGNSGFVDFGGASLLRILRLLRMTRMARAAHLIRAVPELMFLIKGMTIAVRTVFFSLVLLTAVNYTFAVSFAQLSKGTPLGERRFSTTLSSMGTLLLASTIPDWEEIVASVSKEHFLFGVFLLLYVFVAVLTMLNMLIGVLVHVVTVTAAVERETKEIAMIRDRISHIWKTQGLDMNKDSHISIEDFDSMLQVSTVVEDLHLVGVDVIGLVDIRDILFRDNGSMSFPDFMDMVLKLRGSNVSTVKDIMDTRRFMLQELRALEDRMIVWSSQPRSP